MSSDQIPSEYFDLIRDVLKNKGDATQERPLKRRKRRRAVTSELESGYENPQPTEAKIVVNLDSDPELEDKPGASNTISLVSDGEVQHTEASEDGAESDEAYESEEFEDVSADEMQMPSDNLSVTINVNKKDSQSKKESSKIQKNMCSNEDRKFRTHMHCLYLLCLMCHGHIINHWLNNSKMNRKLSGMIPEKVFDMLHPEKDEELPLRSTRKLLDGLKKAMEIWQKHWRIMQRYKGVNCYMRYWDELQICDKSRKTLTKNDFIKGILKGVGDRDVATQGFVALLRSCNVNARLVMSCQPPDFTNLKRSYGTEKKVSYEDMTKYPVFWCEVWDKFSKKWITIDPFCKKTIEQVRLSSKFEPRGVSPCKRNAMRYVIGFDRKEGCRDITRRYCQWFSSKTRKKRITKEAFGERWYERVLASLHKRKRTKIDDYEDAYFDQRNQDEGMPDNMQDFKGHPYYVLEKDIRQNQVLKSGCKECGYLKLHNKTNQVLKVYSKKDIIDLKSAKQWYMEGRILKTGARALKTVEKKRGRFTDPEEQEEERLYQFDDTELYVAPLATRSGEIETNTFGNIEVFVPSMIPANCCLVESPVAIKAASFIGIKFAKAVTAFKFEKGRSVKPSITGVVVALWFRDALVAAIDGITQANAEEKHIEHELEALSYWHNLITKLRIKNKLNSEYGKVNEEESSTVVSQPLIANRFDEEASMTDSGDEFPQGGFLPTDINHDGTSHDGTSDNEIEEPGGFVPTNSNSSNANPDADYHDNEIVGNGGFITTRNQSPAGVTEYEEIKEPGDNLEPEDIDNQKSHLDEDYKDFMDELDMSEQDMSD